MVREADDEVERVLSGLRAGRRDAFDELFHLVYGELRALAARQLQRGQPGNTLAPTGLVHEVYLRFAERSAPAVVDRAHFMAIAAGAMRMIIVDHWRRKHARKRDGRAAGMPPPVTPAPDSFAALDIVAVDDALRRLATLDERQARIVEMRFFAGMNFAEIGAALGLSERTIKREWQKGRAFLHHVLDPTLREAHG